MQFRLGKWAAMSLGLLPYSNVGYSMAEYKEDTDYPSQSSALQYYGDGGLHQLYLGAGFKVLKIFLSVLTSHILGRYNAHKSHNISGKFIYFAADYDNRYIYTKL